MNRTIGHHSNTLEKILCRHGYATTLGHFDGDTADEREIQVRRGNPQGAGTIDRQKYVRQDRHRAFALGHALHPGHDLE